MALGMTSSKSNLNFCYYYYSINQNYTEPIVVVVVVVSCKHVIKQESFNLKSRWSCFAFISALYNSTSSSEP